MTIKPHTEPLEHLFEEDMPESQPQINAADYLKDLLKRSLQAKGVFITGNLAVYPPDNTYPFTYITPDIEIFPVVLTEEEQAHLNSWQMSEPNRPAPTVVFEISSTGTWQEDVGRKIGEYQILGVREYFAFDPQGNWRNTTTRLRGWRYTSGLIQEIQPDSRGWLWSAELESWLAADGNYLRLYDPQGNLRLTGEEAERAEKEAERAEKEAILEKLRKAGIDINNL